MCKKELIVVGKATPVPTRFDAQLTCGPDPDVCAWCMQPNAKRLEIDVPLDTEANYDAAGDRKEIKHITLR